MPPSSGPESSRAQSIAEFGFAVIGIALVACALAANQRWLDRHFLPSFFVSRSLYVLAESVVRGATATLGVVLALVVRRRCGRFFAHNPALTLNICVSVVLAVGASELILRQLHLRAAMEEPPHIEPSRHRDPTLGWVFVPSHIGHDKVGGRVVEYAMDSSGYRERRVDDSIDFGRPTILFTGESMMVGEGLTWKETIPTQVGAIMSMQTANLAISGFASDQAYLRLKQELPRFRRPIAVVTLFTPGIFDRNLDTDRPHLGPGLEWQPAVPRWRLATIAEFLAPYRTQKSIDHGIAATREVLRGTMDLARSRAAIPLIVVPQFTPEGPVERELRQRILDDSGLAYVWVELDPRWRFDGHGHPDARAAHAMAVAIAERLRGQLPVEDAGR